MIEVDLTNEGIVIFVNGGYTYLPIRAVNKGDKNWT